MPLQVMRSRLLLMPSYQKLGKACTLLIPRVFLRVFLFVSHLFIGNSALSELKPYGIFDTGISIVNTGSQDILTVSSGTGTAARLGLRGHEVISDRLSSEFLLETFITMDDGSNYGLGQKLNRTLNSSIFIGLKHKSLIQNIDLLREFSIRLGKQRSVLHDKLYLYDPMRQNLIGSPTGFNLYKMFYSRMIKIIGSFKTSHEKMTLKFMFSPGQQKQNSTDLNESSYFSNDNRFPYGTWGTSMKWDSYPFSTKIGYQLEKMTTLNDQNHSLLAVFKYHFDKFILYGGYLERYPGVQNFFYNEINVKSHCWYLGASFNLARVLPWSRSNSSVYLSYARPYMKSKIIDSENLEPDFEKGYFASQLGIALKKPLSKKSSIFFFAGKLINHGASQFALQAIPFSIPAIFPGGDPSVVGFSINQRL
uniref:Porin n=1 Tax=uncultured beta proteobacterium HF0130_04F21 TaxID=710819 RepID=E0XSU8_9PROT|nr:hypothetical protein [uncultured beta proteobacterium HF0130_04F21]